MTIVGILLAGLLAGPEAGAARSGEFTVSPGLRVDRTIGLATIDAEVVFREGPMELLLCPRRSKEHETIFAAEFKPQDFHLALLLAGAVPGRPVRGEPFQPPLGQRIKIWIEIEDKGGRRLVDAREWIRGVHTRGPLLADFVFAGSQIVKVPGIERPIYLADEGDVVSVANFTGAILDVAMRSENRNSELLFIPWTERIPAKGTSVRLIFEPLVD